MGIKAKGDPNSGHLLYSKDFKYAFRHARQYLDLTSGDVVLAGQVKRPVNLRIDTVDKRADFVKVPEFSYVVQLSDETLSYMDENEFRQKYRCLDIKNTSQAERCDGKATPHICKLRYELMLG